MSGYPGWREAEHLAARALGGLPTVPKANKYRAKKTTVDGQVFDSAHEAKVWQELHVEQSAGAITGLARQRAFPLIVKATDGLPTLIGRYTADFVCRRAGALEIIDAKSLATRTEAYQLRKKLFEALYGLRITER